MYRSILDGTQYVKQGEAANWNFGRYNNPDATAALQTFASSADPAERQAAITKVQEFFVNDMPSIVVRGRPDSAEYTTVNYTGFPNADDPYSGPQPDRTAGVADSHEAAGQRQVVPLPKHRPVVRRGSFSPHHHLNLVRTTHP